MPFSLYPSLCSRPPLSSFPLSSFPSPLFLPSCSLSGPDRYKARSRTRRPFPSVQTAFDASPSRSPRPAPLSPARRPPSPVAAPASACSPPLAHLQRRSHSHPRVMFFSKSAVRVSHTPHPRFQTCPRGPVPREQHGHFFFFLSRFFSLDSGKVRRSADLEERGAESGLGRRREGRAETGRRGKRWMRAHLAHRLEKEREKTERCRANTKGEEEARTRGVFFPPKRKAAQSNADQRRRAR